MTPERAFLAALLHGNDRGALAGGRVEDLLDVYLAVCAELGVDDPADPMAQRIARYLILLAAEGVEDRETLKTRTIAEMRSG